MCVYTRKINTFSKVTQEQNALALPNMTPTYLAPSPGTNLYFYN